MLKEEFEQQKSIACFADLEKNQPTSQYNKSGYFASSHIFYKRSSCFKKQLNSEKWKLRIIMNMESFNLVWNTEADKGIYKKLCRSLSVVRGCLYPICNFGWVKMDKR